MGRRGEIFFRIFSDLKIIFGLSLFGFRSQQMLWRNFCKFLSSLPLLEKQSVWFSPTTLPHQVWLPSHCRQIPAPCSQTRRNRHHYAKRHKNPNNCKIYSQRFQLSKQKQLYSTVKKCNLEKKLYWLYCWHFASLTHAITQRRHHATYEWLQTSKEPVKLSSWRNIWLFGSYIRV